MERLDNPIRNYAWGSRRVIAQIQGRPVPSPGPEAELWVGAHPADPSRLARAGIPLTELIEAAPAEVLSAPVLVQHGPRLPYLLKLLAAESPLSLQAHPDPAQAAAGYAAEEAAGVPRDAPQRRYVDPYHKPELLVAASRFRALCGFRDPVASARRLEQLGVAALAPVVAQLAVRDLAGAVRTAMTLPDPERLTAQLARAAAADWPLAAELATSFPGDRGAVVALLLNEVDLAPTEAIFLPAGNLHCYLHGTGVEILAASDNVLRGGLTGKHVDVPELLRVLRFEPLREPVIRPVPVAPGVVTWPVPVAEFALYRVRLDADVDAAALLLRGPRLVLCLAGQIRAEDGSAPLTLRGGEAGFAPASDGPVPLRLSGTGEAYVASVGGADPGS